MTRIYIVRHCEAEGNLSRVFQGATDADITELGRRQLDVLAEVFKDIRLDAIYASPLIRAGKTADAINKYHGLTVKINPDLREINAGDMEGVKWSELAKKFPEQGGYWNREPWKFRAPGGDSMAEVYDRMWRGVCGIVEENHGKTVAAVSHGGAIRTLLCRVTGRPLDRINEVEWSDNTAISVIEFGADLNARVVSQNDSGHLPDELSSFALRAKEKGLEGARRRLKFDEDE